ncbi:MAG TPA: DUF1499 domain-containing protein [Gemmatimonadaceae bacterium]|nr:DUF1499 domain-containing protein [Gemmatimonadaceae bacterium]
MTSTMPRRGLPLIVAVGLFITLLGVIAEMVSGFGYRFHMWDLGVAFRIFVYGSWVAAAGGVLCLLAALATRPGTGRRGFGMSVLGVLIAIAGFGTVMQWKARAEKVPPIHDISTDLANPPAFVAVLPLRAAAPNKAEYDTAAADSVAEKQRRGYPELGPVMLPVPPGAAFHVALAAARDMGWTIVASDSASGRIEATATTTWFGFKDDVVVRIGPDPKGSRVDVRSESRVGGSDVGTNAARIKKYEQRLTARV